MESKRVLFLAASPWDEARIGFDAEYRKIKQALRQSNLREQFEFELSLALQADDIQQEINQFKPHVIHFSGHGTEDALAFSNSHDKAEWVDMENLRGLFKIIATHVECVVLNACYSEAQAEVIAEYIDCVIGMKFKIGDIAAEKFSTGFYSSLFNGDDYATAYQHGCQAIRQAGMNDQATIPVLKKRRQTYIPTYQHDVFISFANAEANWANDLIGYLHKQLKQKLATAEGFQLYTGNDFNQLAQSATLLIIASPAYCLQYQAQFEQLGQFAKQQPVFLVEYEVCKPRPEILKGFTPYKFWLYDDTEGMKPVTGDAYFATTDELVSAMAKRLIELRNEHQHQRRVDQQRKEQQDAREQNPDAKPIEGYVFLLSSLDDLNLINDIVPFLDEKDIDYFTPIEQASASQIREDITNHIMKCDAVLILYENTTQVWVRDQLSTCKYLQRKRETPLKIIAVYKNPDKPDIGCSPLENLRIYSCSPEQISRYIPDFIEELLT